MINVNGSHCVVAGNREVFHARSRIRHRYLRSLYRCFILNRSFSRPRLARRDSPSRFGVARRMVPTGKNNALEIQMTKRGGRAAIYQIKAVVQSNTRPCRQWKRQFIFNIKRGEGEVFRDVVAKRIWQLCPGSPISRSTNP